MGVQGKRGLVFPLVCVNARNIPGGVVLFLGALGAQIAK